MCIFCYSFDPWSSIIPQKYFAKHLLLVLFNLLKSDLAEFRLVPAHQAQTVSLIFLPLSRNICIFVVDLARWTKHLWKDTVMHKMTERSDWRAKSLVRSWRPQERQQDVGLIKEESFSILDVQRRPVDSSFWVNRHRSVDFVSRVIQTLGQIRKLTVKQFILCPPFPPKMKLKTFFVKISLLFCICSNSER